ncbi:Aldo/keto reductase family protein [Handroanthus impetiginosus]|uniref:Aldo/keto reductase family protein n=1 Tax=Handroanthus impetiginosus TaxID=429701 RepID=A0A2G9G9J4_9LAMI|nr:Aldo/keto reductase family protein [Handroanthus impetiginosus]
MEKVQIPQVVLNSGQRIPAIGLGTASSPPLTVEQLTPVLLDAIAAGYRHFDTAALYRTEDGVGRAVAEALDRKMVKSRDELFITSKLWCTDAHHDLVVPALQETLRKLGLQYVDLYLIHWPIRMKMDGTNSKMMHFDIKETWEAMEHCCRLGLAKSIGVSNFSCAKLSKLLENATIPPAVNQVEMSVGWQQQKMVQFCKEKGIQVSAWSPLGAYGSPWGTNAVMDSPILKQIAAAKSKTKAQTLSLIDSISMVLQVTPYETWKNRLPHYKCLQVCGCLE